MIIPHTRAAKTKWWRLLHAHLNCHWLCTRLIQTAFTIFPLNFNLLTRIKSISQTSTVRTISQSENSIDRREVCIVLLASLSFYNKHSTRLRGRCGRSGRILTFSLNCLVAKGVGVLLEAPYALSTIPFRKKEWPMFILSGEPIVELLCSSSHAFIDFSVPCLTTLEKMKEFFNN